MNTTTYPQIGVGAVVLHHDAVLLVKRNTPPFLGQWVIPGGKLKLGETLQQAAEREILEETGVSIRAGDVIYHFEIIQRDNDHNVQWHYVVLDLSATYLDGIPSPRDDAADARWITRHEIIKLPINPNTKQLLREKYRFP